MLYRKDFGGVLATKSAWPILVLQRGFLPSRFGSASQIESRKSCRGAGTRQTDRIGELASPGLDSFPQRSRRPTPNSSTTTAICTPGLFFIFFPKGKHAEGAKEARRFPG